MIDLRPYQSDVIAKFHETAATTRRIIVVSPTGSGKTVIAGSIIKDYIKQHQEILVLAHRREIVGQTSDELRGLGISHGIIQAGYPLMPLAEVQVASIQTLSRRAIRGDRMKLPPAKLIIIDECHHAPAKSWRDIINAYPDAVILGLTATPCRGDGRGLGGIFEEMLECPQVYELIKLGFLVPSRLYAPADPDLAGVDVRQGDYVASQLAERMDKAKLIADIVSTWHKHSERRKTVCFASSVGHSIHLRDEFVKSGVRAEHIDGGTPKDERDATLARLASGEIELVTNCMVLTEGWNMPEVGTCILARPTRQMGLYRQMIGRVLRPAPGKTCAIILDHSGAVFRHGLPEDHVYWSLDPEKQVSNRDHEKRGSDSFGGPKILECTQCGAIREGGKPCSACGFLPVKKPQLVTVRDGDLALVKGGKPGKAEQNKTEWHAMLVGICVEKGWQIGAASHKFVEKFGHWPPIQSKYVEPITPSPEVRSWVRSRAIAWAKSQAPRPRP
jgi:DNA repair protein RadD